MKAVERWYSSRVEQDTQLVRWGSWGIPVLVFPTAGGDAEEIERFLMIRALAPLIQGGKIKVYSVDSIAGAAWLSKSHSAAYCARLQTLFDAYLVEEVVPAIRADCKDPGIEIVAAGASIGAFNALTLICRHPELVSKAICMSGTYDIEHWLGGEWHDDFYFSSPLHFVPGMAEDSPALAALRHRFVLLPTGEGAWEAPEESWNVARMLGERGIPNRVDPWGPDYRHDWPTWREMLPKYLGELVS